MTSTLKMIRDKVHGERESPKGLPYFISTALAEAMRIFTVVILRS